MACDGLTTCGFLIRPIEAVFGLDNFAVQSLRASTGWDIDMDDWKNMLQRLRYMERSNCIREGYVPTRDDVMPDRFFEETIYNKYGHAKILDRNEFITEREKTYLSFGLTAEGIPKPDLLKKLDMDFVIPVLQKQLGSL